MTSPEVQQHNQTVLDNLQPGDLLEFDRGRINHWAVYIGNREVVHFLGVGGAGGLKHQCKKCVVKFCKGVVHKEGFGDVPGNSKVYKNNSKDTKLKPFQPDEIVRRASCNLGVVDYNIVLTICEHFATWCRYGKTESDQVGGLFKVAAVAVGGFTVAVGLLAAFFGRK
ncbi:phospholipase A and acyltransferase 3-like [Haliotis rubra]|uniref:phospholipase A and acyltransferase 3-like n=1 Tax=Haliotis rubra TaxID=36100 RepID=UPI001EE602F3|nr:phospholipase A and acyltransferase 3-like [Haliotis rubra]